MSRIAVAADTFRRNVLTHEEESATALVAQYGQIYAELSASLDNLTEQVIRLLAEGKPVSRDLLFRRTRIESLLQQVEQSVAEFALFAAPAVALEQAFAVEAAQEAAASLIRTAIGPLPNSMFEPVNFLTFNPGAVEQLIGRSSDGSPLRELFATLTDEPVEAIQNVFIRGITQGLNPRDIAAELKADFQVPLSRALTISRTETLQSYREANREYFHQNSRVVDTWRWQCAFQLLTCPMCLAMDGHEFETDVMMGTHPNCRCVLVPVTKSWKELGFEDVPDQRSISQLTGEEWFAKQTPANQLEILGPAKFERYLAGKLTLRQLIGYRDDPAWGPTRFERSLKQISSRKARPPKATLGILRPK